MELVIGYSKTPSEPVAGLELVSEAATLQFDTEEAPKPA
jgi:hypothetical protein